MENLWAGGLFQWVGNQDVERRASGRIVPLTGGFGALRGLLAG